MEKTINLPKIGTLHGVFAQGRIEPETVTVFQGWTRMTTNNHGEMNGEPLQGLFCAETRLITFYKLLLNEKPLRHRLSAQLSATEWSSTGAVPHSGDSGDLRSGKIPQGALEARILRKCGKGLTEQVFVKNNGNTAREVDLQIRLASPITDSEFSEENKGDRKASTQGVRPSIHQGSNACILRFERDFGKRRKTPTQELCTIYGYDAPKAGTTVKRGLEIKISKPSQTNINLQIKGGTQPLIRARARLGPREEFCIQLAFEPLIDGVRMPAPPMDGLAPLPREDSNLAPNALSVRSSNATFDLVLGQAQSDITSLRLPLFGKSHVSDPERYQSLIAGVPRYIGLFGRDTVIAAWQALLFDSSLLEPVLSRLELLQGIKTENWRDEEPGRMLHERRLDPLAELGKLNRNLYYGDVTSTPFWVLALCDLYRWTGDENIIRTHQTSLRRCCYWILQRMIDGDGLIYYAPAKKWFADENRNQAWKDSGDAIVDEAGRIKTPPLALAEVQGYAYQALVDGADLIELSGSQEEALELRDAAQNLKARFNKHFWIQEIDFYALALDGRKRPLRSRASNIGHCLATGIIDEMMIPSVVQGLMAEDMFSGWGIRTLSSHNPGYDPFSYHRGSVWPVENAMIASGMASRGYRSEANSIITGQLSLAAVFQHLRLPEVFGGHHRDKDSPLPGIYNFANMLQAWSVSAISQFLQTMLGIRPRADQAVLYLDPSLPEWLDKLEVRNLRIKDSEIDILFERQATGASTWKLLRNSGSIRVAAHTESTRKVA